MPKPGRSSLFRAHFGALAKGEAVTAPKRWSAWIVAIMFLCVAASQAQTLSTTPAENMAAPSQYWAEPLGIGAKKPVFAGACKACPWGQLAQITREALLPYGYDIHICWTCATSVGTRDMADKVANQQQLQTRPDSPFRAYIEMTPPHVPDISATNESALIDAWNGTGVYAVDNKKRQNYRIIATVYSPSYYVIAVRRGLGITSLAQVKNRRGTYIVAADNDPALKLYGITSQTLEKNGGALISANAPRELRAGADIWIGNASLQNTWENRMWYEISQINDLQFLDLEPDLVKELLSENYRPAVMPLALLRGIDRPIPTVSRPGGTAIYVRDDAPASFAYTVAKALDENRVLFTQQIQPWYYDTALLGGSGAIPLHPGARKYYLEKGYIHN